MKPLFFPSRCFFLCLFSPLFFAAGCFLIPSPPPEQTCADGIKNFTEEEVDCGGDCLSCGTCSDGIQNGIETAIDCGGKCASCTCKNNRLDPGETMIDCGGVCNSCDVPVCTLPVNSFIFRNSVGYETPCKVDFVGGQLTPSLQSISIYATDPDGYRYRISLFYSGNTLSTTGTQSYRISYSDYSPSSFFDLQIYPGSSWFPMALDYDKDGYILLDCNNGKITISSCSIFLNNNERISFNVSY